MVRFSLVQYKVQRQMQMKNVFVFVIVVLVFSAQGLAVSCFIVFFKVKVMKEAESHHKSKNVDRQVRVSRNTTDIKWLT